MLFNSGEFCFIFLPVTLALFYAAAHFHLTRLAIQILGIASAFFYLYATPIVPGPWGIPVPPYLLLLLGSIVGNYTIGARLRHHRSRWFLAFGVSANLLVLSYFKYANFFVHNFDAWTGLGLLPALAMFHLIMWFGFTRTLFRPETGSSKRVGY